jgi:hypothetical protein
VLVLTEPDERGDFLAARLTSRDKHLRALSLRAEDLALGRLPKATWLRPEKLFTLNGDGQEST